MSTFGGRLKEYPYLSIDRFDGDNVRSQMFFLSHCHEDHMQGLTSSEFFKVLKKNNFKIYMQEITAHLLLSDPVYVHLKPFVVPLQVNMSYPFSRNVEDSQQSFVVTLLSAGHCPGSVMFFFEGNEGNVLYTGDIRLTRTDIELMPVLKSNGTVKQIRSVYFDSTFCIRQTYTIPTRKESTDTVISLVDYWFKQNPKNKVLLSCAAKYGQEYLMCELSNHFGMKIHIPESKKAIYSQIPDIAVHVTTQAAETRIHACSYWEHEMGHGEFNRKTSANVTCPDCKFWEKHVIVIKPSMLYFAQTKSANKTIHKDERGIYRIMYSSHSSLKEIREILAYLRPTEAHPNVAPYKSNFNEIHDAIKDLLPKSPRKNISPTPESVQPEFGNLVTLAKRTRLMNEAEDITVAKICKLSSTPQKQCSTVKCWDELFNDDDSDDNSSPLPEVENHSQDINSTETPTKVVCSADDDWLYSSQNKGDEEQNQKEAIVLSQESGKDLFVDDAKEELAPVEQCSESDQDLFDLSLSNETVDLISSSQDNCSQFNHSTASTVDPDETEERTLIDQQTFLNDSSSIEILNDNCGSTESKSVLKSSSVEIIEEKITADIQIVYEKPSPQKQN